MVAYTIKKSNKTKRVSIRINANREIFVTIPPRVPQYIAKQFIDYCF